MVERIDLTNLLLPILGFLISAIFWYAAKSLKDLTKNVSDLNLTVERLITSQSLKFDMVHEENRQLSRRIDQLEKDSRMMRERISQLKG